MATKKFEVTEKLVNKLSEVISHGLTCGLGNPKPGQMCVEAAVCYALGEDHGDEPSCVDYSVSNFKICLNDREEWRSNKNRADGLLRVAIAQLGTKRMKGIKKFDSILHLWLISQFADDIIEDKILRRAFRHLSLGNIQKARRIINAYSKLDDLVGCDDYGEIGWISSQIEYPDFEALIPVILDSSKNRLNALKKIAQCAVDVLEYLQSPGSKYLHLVK